MKPGYSGPQRPPQGYGRPPGIFDGAPVTKWLLISNIAIYFLNFALTAPGRYPVLWHWGEFSVELTFYKFQLWRVLSFQFLHGGIGHLLGNMIGIFFFAPHLERWMSSRIFAFYYLLCGVSGAMFFTTLTLFTGLFDGDPSRAMVGASAGIFGILAAYFFIAPNAKVYLLFFIPMKMRTFGILYFAFEVFNVLNRGWNYGGSVGHLGGALLGILIMKNSVARGWLTSLASIGTNSKPRQSKTRDATIIRESNRSPLEVTGEVNRILDKISREGIQSLTPQERETLDRSRKN